MYNQYLPADYGHCEQNNWRKKILRLPLNKCSQESTMIIFCNTPEHWISKCWNGILSTKRYIYFSTYWSRCHSKFRNDSYQACLEKYYYTHAEMEQCLSKLLNKKICSSNNNVDPSSLGSGKSVFPQSRSFFGKRFDWRYVNDDPVASILLTFLGNINVPATDYSFIDAQVLTEAGNIDMHTIVKELQENSEVEDIKEVMKEENSFEVKYHTKAISYI